MPLNKAATHIATDPVAGDGHPFHITMVRGVNFRPGSAKGDYFAKMQVIIDGWIARHPDGILFNDGGVDLFQNREVIAHCYPPSLEQGVNADLDALRQLWN